VGKTVEYMFFLKAFEERFVSSFAPLDGNAETIGDLTFSNDTEFFIIEFKKELSKLEGEYSKFKDGLSGYLKAAEQMKINNSSKAHFIIGGKLSGKVLELDVREYFDLTSEFNGSIHDIFSNGLTLKEFNEYTKKYTELKKHSDEDGDSSDSNDASLGVFVNESVLAISLSTRQASVFPLDYYKAPKQSNKNNIKSTVKSTKVKEEIHITIKQGR